MLCSVCQNIDFDRACNPDPAIKAEHHESLDALEDSADEGCELCQMICDYCRQNFPGRAGYSGIEPIECFTVRQYDCPQNEWQGDSTIIFQEGPFSRWVTELGIFTHEDAVPAGARLVGGRLALASPESDECYSLASKWITECLNEHKDSCPHSSEYILPTRVIDVGNSTTAPFLLVTRERRGEWVALSHCWGRKAKFVTDSATLEERQHAIVMDDLPKTFRDAVTVTRRLGYRYLWIDSLCILQDSREDWESEAGKMQDYYSNAILTIAADSAEGDHEGFLNFRERPESIKVPFQHAALSTPNHVFIGLEVPIFRFQKKKMPLNQRAWTLQEDVLSPRTLHYTSTQLVFECQKQTRTETDATPQGYNDEDQWEITKRHLLRPDSGMEDPDYDPIRRWYNLLESYCQRLLTFEGDKLAAITGLAKVIGKQTGYNYKAGIFLEDMHKGLLWGIAGRGSRPSHYRAPSWSWAALNFQISSEGTDSGFGLYDKFVVWGAKAQDPCPAEFIKCEIETENDDPNSRILHGRLIIRGSLLPCSLWEGKSPPYRNIIGSEFRHFKNSNRQRGASDQLICDFDIVEASEESEDEEGKPSDFEEESVSEISDSSDSSEDGYEDCESEEQPGDSSEDGYEDGESNEEFDGNDWDRRILDDMSLFRIASFECEWYEVDSPIVYALLLKEIAESEAGATYQRVGIAHFLDIDGLGEKGWEKKEVTIV